MQEISMQLKAKNSSGEQTLFLTAADGEAWFTLLGQYRGEKIQIDFDAITLTELEDIKAAVELVLESLTSRKN